MDGQQFDAAIRALAARKSRRGTFRTVAAATGALFIASLPIKARAGFNCSYYRLRLRHGHPPPVQRRSGLLCVIAGDAWRRRGLLSAW
jgi:hypothetical protein